MQVHLADINYLLQYYESKACQKSSSVQLPEESTSMSDKASLYDRCQACTV